MVGKNLLWVAEQHIVQIMLAIYGAWFEGLREADVEGIRRPIGRLAYAFLNCYSLVTAVV